MRIVAFVLSLLCNVLVGSLILAIAIGLFADGIARIAIGTCILLVLGVSILFAAGAAHIAGAPFMREISQPLPLIAFTIALSMVAMIVDIAIIIACFLAAKSYAI